jgi:hypothetical protein
MVSRHPEAWFPGFVEESVALWQLHEDGLGEPEDIATATTRDAGEQFILALLARTDYVATLPRRSRPPGCVWAARYREGVLHVALTRVSAAAEPEKLTTDAKLALHQLLGITWAKLVAAQGEGRPPLVVSVGYALVGTAPTCRLLAAASCFYRQSKGLNLDAMIDEFHGLGVPTA